MSFTKFQVDLTSLLNFNLLISVTLGPIALFYTYIRFDKVLASMLGSVCFLATMIPVLCLTTYIACALGTNLRLYDDVLAAFDANLGFQWPWMMRWAVAHPMVSEVGRLAYLSIFAQAASLVVVLSVRRQAERLQVVLYAFVLGALLCSVVSGLMPALGAYSHYAIDPAAHVGIELQVRNSTVQTVLDLRSGRFAIFSALESKGIISFPSFHTVLGVLLTWGFWRLSVLRWCAVTVNATLIAATPLQGSHYLADILSGFVVALVAIAAGSLMHASVSGIRSNRWSDESGDIATGSLVA